MLRVVGGLEGGPVEEGPAKVVSEDADEAGAGAVNTVTATEADHDQETGIIEDNGCSGCCCGF